MRVSTRTSILLVSVVTLTDRGSFLGSGLAFTRRVANVLAVDLSTVQNHVEHVYEKLGARRRTATLVKLRRARELH
jgi:DNA-binding NarL/FixJ family response regulator